MSNFFNALVRSVIEAVTEFLPVSSTGHLFLFSNYFPFTGLGEKSVSYEDLFDIFIQSGAIFSVLVLYFRFLAGEVKSALLYVFKKTDNPNGLNFCISLIIGCFPIMIVGFLFKNYLDRIKSSQWLLLILSLSWMIGGVVIIFVEKKFSAKEEIHSPGHRVSIRQSIIIGCLQCLALIPGVSRSAATIITARSLGLSKKLSSEFSFFLAVPVLLTAGFYKLFKYRDLLNGEFMPVLIVGSFFSFLFCFAVIRWFLLFIKKHNFQIFGYYRILLGLVVLFLFLK